MENDFIYWRHDTPVGVRVEEVSGGDNKSAEVWRSMAMQIYCEYGKEGDRNVIHTDCGAPLLDSEQTRISLTHTKGLLAVASLPRTPEADLNTFNPRTAMGIDAERADRRQVLKIRQRFLNDEELQKVPTDNLTAHIIAWTAKEALYKAMMTDSADYRHDLVIEKMPELMQDLSDNHLPEALGQGYIIIKGIDGKTEKFPMTLYSYASDDTIVTIAVSPKAARFKGKKIQTNNQ